MHGAERGNPCYPSCVDGKRRGLKFDRAIVLLLYRFNFYPLDLTESTAE